MNVASIFALDKILTVILLVATVIAIIYFDDEVVALAERYLENSLVGMFLYVTALTMAVVAMPLTVMPLIPVATAIFGPFFTGVLSVVGWTLGATIAFFLARFLRRSFLRNFLSLEKADSFIREIPENNKILMIFLFRMTLPVDFVSYALGFCNEIRFREYFLGTFLGVIWFSFAFAYLGEALFSSNHLLFIEIVAGSVIVFVLALFLIKKSKSSK